LPAGVYGVARPLVLRSRVHLVGEGRGKTVLRSLVHSPGKTVDDTGVWALVATVGADGASISALTVDLSFSRTHANGIALLPTGADFEGTPSTNSEIADTEVIGGGNYHAYMIWNLRGQGIRIVNNVVDGRISEHVDSNQEGIESYGGKDVLIGWNDVRNIGNTALNFGSAGLPNSGIDGLTVIGNVVTNSARGLNIAPWIGPTGPQNIANVQIEQNEFTDIWKTGIYIPIFPGTETTKLSIRNNSISNVGLPESSGTAGIYLQGPSASTFQSIGDETSVVIECNTITSVKGHNSFGILINQFPNVSLINNTMSDIDYNGIQSVGSTNLEINRNTISRVQRIGFESYGSPSSISLLGNIFEEWDQADRMVSAVHIDGATQGEVRDNIFRKELPLGSVVRVEVGAANVVVFGNTVSSSERSAEPFINLGVNSNVGTFVAPPEGASVAIESAIVTPTSRVVIEQRSGEPLEFSVVPEAGAFRVFFASYPGGGEEFRYEVDP
jgi:hypothetical protein